MNFARYVRKNLLFRKTGNILSLVLISTAIAILWMVQESKKQAEAHLERNLAEIDLVAGAKGSPMQLILSAVFHMDAPTGNISYGEAKRLSGNKMVASAIPLSLGDNYSGYRIVGTVEEYPALYNAGLSDGRWWKEDMEVCIGALVAGKGGLKKGDSFPGAHGFDKDGDAHGAYKVVGIMEKTGTVLDQLILTSLESVWKVHGEEHQHEDAHEEAEDHGHGEEDNREITALLIRYRMPMAAIQLPRYINENTAMQAAAPAIEINRLYHLLNLGGNALEYFGFGLLLLAWLSILVSFLKSLEERRFELALLRSFGASAWKVTGILLAEYGFLTFTGWLTGLAGGRLLLQLLGESFNYGSAYHFQAWTWSSYDVVLLGLALAASCIAVLIPSRKIFKLSIPDLLSSR